MAVSAARSLDNNLIDVAPLPVFARFEAPDDRVLAAVEVRCRVLSDRIVAAAYVAAAQAEPQVHPAHTCFQALLTSLRCAWSDVLYLRQVGAACHRSPDPVNAGATGDII